MPDPAPELAAWPRLWLEAWPIGRLAPGHRELLLPLLAPHARLRDGDLLWQPPAAERSARIQAAAETLRERGLIRGWRGEAYACETPVDDPCRERGAELFRLERAAFRFLGLMSRAVHINGWWPDGRMLCGRRALSKATDPGKLDNLAAGGLGAGEALMDCARRFPGPRLAAPDGASSRLDLLTHLTVRSGVLPARHHRQERRSIGLRVWANPKVSPTVSPGGPVGASLLAKILRSAIRS